MADQEIRIVGWTVQWDDEDRDARWYSTRAIAADAARIHPGLVCAIVPAAALPLNGRDETPEPEPGMIPHAEVVHLVTPETWSKLVHCDYCQTLLRVRLINLYVDADRLVHADCPACGEYATLGKGKQAPGTVVDAIPRDRWQD